MHVVEESPFEVVADGAWRHLLKMNAFMLLGSHVDQKGGAFDFGSRVQHTGVL